MPSPHSMRPPAMPTQPKHTAFIADTWKALFAAALIVAYLLVTASHVGHESYNLLLLSILPTGMVAIYLLVSRTTDLLAPPFIILGLCILGINIRLYNIVTDSTHVLEHVLLPGIGIAGLSHGITAITVGVGALLAGYSVTVAPQRLVRWTSASHTWHPQRLKFLAVPLLLVSAVSVLVYAQQMNLPAQIAAGRISMARRLVVAGSEYGAASSYLIWGAKLAEALYYILLARRYTNESSRGSTIFLVTLFLFSTIVPIVSSQRSAIFNMLLISLIMRHYLYRPTTGHSLLLLTAAALVSLGILTQFRIVSQTGDSLTSDASTYTGNIEDTLSKPYFLGVAKTSVIVAAVPDRIDFLHGRSLTLWLLAPIPRTVWPGKPAVRIGPFVAQTIYGRTNHSGVPPGFLAELYMNFGYIGLVLGSLLLGLVLRILYQTFVVLSPHTAHGILVHTFLSLHLTLTLLSSDLTGTISAVALYLLPILIALRIIFPRTSPLH